MNNLLKTQFAVLGTISAVVIGVYAWTAKSGCWEVVGGEAVNSYYNLLVQGFRAGQLHLRREVPVGLTQLADPYDPEANAPSLMHGDRPLYDLSYYRGKLHLYFGITPALALLWPYYELTGCYLLHRHAVVIFCAVGFLASAGLLWAVWRRYFMEVGAGVIGVCILGLGLASSTVLLLAPCDVYEVAVSCGYALVMLTLVAIGKALLELGTGSRDFGKGTSTFRPPSSALVWLAGASLAYGLALGARPSLLFGTLILLVPVVQPRPKTEGRRRNSPFSILPSSLKIWLAVAGPITVLGLGLLFYNYLRFDNPLEFGQRFQLAGNRQAAAQQFSLSYLWINFRTAFLEPAQWSSRFPFVYDIAVPPLPRGYNVEHPFGALSNIPLVWLTLATPLAWRGRRAGEQSPLRRVMAAAVLGFGISALTLCLHNSMNIRYEVEFLPALVLLAVLGVLSLERAFTERPLWRRTVRCGWGLLTAVSALFSLLGTFGLYAGTHVVLGRLLAGTERGTEAVFQYEKALKLQPHNADAHHDFGVTLCRQGITTLGIWHLQEALRLNPDFAEARNNLGTEFFKLGRVAEAVRYYEQALRLKPDLAEAEKNLGVALLQQGKTAEGIAHLREAAQLTHNNAEVHFEFGKALLDQAAVATAIEHLEKALRLKPDHVRAHNSLAVALVQTRRVPEAIGHLEQALRLKPDFVEAHNNLGMVLFGLNKVPEAIGHLEEALRLRPEDFTAHFNLGTAVVRMGQAAKAIACYEQALRLRPGHIEVCRNLAWLLATCRDEKLRNGARAVELAQAANRQVEGQDPLTLDALAAAYAETGQFEAAMKTGQTALELLRTAGQRELAEAIEGRLKLYGAGQPYREGSPPGVDK